MKTSFSGLIIAVSLFLAACSGSGNTSYDYASYVKTDSIVRQIRSLDSLHAVEKHADSGDKLTQAIAWREIGKKQRNAGNYDDALVSCGKALRLAVEIPDTLEITQSYNNYGTTYRRMGILDMAAEHHYKALAYSMQYSDTTTYHARKNRVVSLNGLGNVYLTLHNNHLADSVFRQALAGEKALGSALGQAINYANIGALFEDEGNIDSARVYYQMSMEMNRKINSTTGIALCLSHFGRLYEKEERYDDAVKEFTEAYNLMKDAGDDWHWMDACTALSRVYYNKGDYAQFRHYIAEANATALRLQSQEYLIIVYNMLYAYNDRIGNKAQALHYYTQADILEDSLFNTKELNEIENMRISLLQRNSEAEISLAQKIANEERGKKIWAYVLFGVFFVLAVLVITLLYMLLRARIKTQDIQREMLNVRENFFANITHEFRTPIMVINGLSEKIASDEKFPIEEIKAFGETINRAGNNLLELVSQLLDITKVKSAIGGQEWRHGNIVPFMRMLTDNYRQYARERGVQIDFKTHETELYVDMVPDYIKKIVRNLISNALKNTPAGGHISILVYQHAPNLVITISDDGNGIAPDALGRIFEPFYQSGKDSGNIGTGIGLVLVKQIVECLKGQITVESNLGEGSVFTIMLPMSCGRKLPALEDTADMKVAMPYVTKQGDVPDDDSVNMTKDTVLIVEDNNDSATYIAGYLRDKYNIVFASNGEEALEKMASLIPDIIITDLMMPYMSGHELCSAVRESETLCHVPIVILTARAGEEN